MLPCLGPAEGAEPIAGGAVAAVAALTLLPLVNPLAQIWLLGQKSKEGIEANVRLSEPLQVCVLQILLHAPHPAP